MQGFNLISDFSRTKQVRGGSAIFVKNGLQSKNIPFLINVSVESVIEMSGVCLYLNGRDTVAICSVYRPPSGDCNIFFEHLENAIRNIISKYRYIILCGDFNINYLDSSTNTKTLFDLFNCFSLLMQSHDPTRIGVNANGSVSRTGIDYMVSNLPKISFQVELFDPYLADHFGHLGRLTYAQDTLVNKPLDLYVNKRCLGDINLKEFSFLLNKSDWTPMYGLSVNEAFDFFVEIVIWCFHASCPFKKCKLSKRQNGWLNEEIKREKGVLAKISKDMKRTNDVNTLIAYRAQKNKYKKMVRDAKRNFYGNKIINSENQTKEIWKTVNTTLDRVSNRNTPLILNINGKMTSEVEVVAHQFGDYFSHIAAKQSAEHFGYNLTLPHTVSEICMNTLFCAPITKIELIKTINDLRNKKSSSFDEISPALFKRVALSVLDQLLFLINLCLVNGTFPDILKTAVVTPVFKKGNRNDIENYRPISVVSVFSKVLEKVIYEKIMIFFNKFNILSNRQHGFRPGHSIETASAHFYEFIYEQVDQGKYVVSMFFDLSKAFDLVNTNILIDKLEGLGIRGNLKDCIVSFMSNRSLMIKYNNHMSDLFKINLGVPQGSILGPLLFLIYVNDLPDYMGGEVVTMYADDTSITVSADTPEELNGKVKGAVDRMTSWCERNKLILNKQKTVYLNFNVRKPLPNSPVGLSHSTKFLGTYLQDNFSWDTNVDHVAKKLNSAYYAIFQLRSALDKNALLNCYYALAYSHISQSIMLWGKCSGSLRVFVCQKRIIRLIFNLGPRETCKSVFVSQKILTVPCIYIYKCLVYVRNNLSKFSSLTSRHTYNTRSEHVLVVPRHRTANFEVSLSYNAVTLYNKLPAHFKCLSIRLFKIELRTFLVERAYYSFKEYIETDNQR